MSYEISKWLCEVKSSDQVNLAVGFRDITGAPRGPVNVEGFIGISIELLDSLEEGFGDLGKRPAWLPYSRAILGWDMEKSTSFVDFGSTRVDLASASLGISKDGNPFFWASWEQHQVSMSLADYGRSDFRLVQRSYITHHVSEP